jgi:hypothetical protein
VVLPPSAQSCPGTNVSRKALLWELDPGDTRVSARLFGDDDDDSGWLAIYSTNVSCNALTCVGYATSNTQAVVWDSNPSLRYFMAVASTNSDTESAYSVWVRVSGLSLLLQHLY